ncbi:hypothetical protein WS1993 [Wolinella succinogenes]|uniref:Uncharacterized protein n=1 Tax=Wolinella succinogenes (strain ATCC 29543 / DSM 1740 / CCUG 13145 / JCM 31913 / LMG 7466 / NCTC 11488 / FDC 602W) TaxID=273121 RepID=Q7MQU7_WOLSU|nr:hypothetical protein WS1993 [Wolinella succinogenes]
MVIMMSLLVRVLVRLRGALFGVSVLGINPVEAKLMHLSETVKSLASTKNLRRLFVDSPLLGENPFFSLSLKQN